MIIKLSFFNSKCKAKYTDAFIHLRDMIDKNE